MTESLISGKKNAAVYNDTTIEIQSPALRDQMTDSIRNHAQTAIPQAVWATWMTPWANTR